MASNYSTWKHNKRRMRSVIMGVLIGTVIGAGVGYAVGYIVIPLFQFQSEALRDHYAAGILFCWSGGIIGFLGGARIGENLHRYKRRAELREARKGRYDWNSAEIEAERRQDEEERERERAENVARAASGRKEKSKSTESSLP